MIFREIRLKRFGWRDLVGEIRLKRFGTNNFNKVFHLKMESTVGVLWSSYFVFGILIEGCNIWMVGFRWRDMVGMFNWKNITLKGDG